MRRRGFRVAANEWDAFYSRMLHWTGAVFVTTFRHPVERYFSQYRFEHLEHRDGSTAADPVIPMKHWYLSQRSWTMGRYDVFSEWSAFSKQCSDYYVKTFIGTPDNHAPDNPGDFYWVSLR